MALLAPGLALAQPLSLPHDLSTDISNPVVPDTTPAPFRLAQQASGTSTEPRETTRSSRQHHEVRNYEPLYTLTDLGDIKVLQTPSPGRLHVHGAFTVSSADYFRGRYDGVGLINRDNEIDEVQLAPSLSVTLELLEDAGFLRNFNFVGGTVNSLAKRPAGATTANIWYESNNYVGLAAALGPTVLAGLTYTAYTSPNNEFPFSDELALAFQWSGTLGQSWRLNPHVKAAWPLAHRGIYVEGGIAPEVNLGMLMHAPLTLALPVVLGVGVDDYYGRGSDYTGYVKAGVVANLSLKRYVPATFGNWNLHAGVHATGRERALREASSRFSGGLDDAGELIVEGSVGMSFTY